MALHVLSALSVAAMFAAGLRVSSHVTSDGLERVVGAAVIAVAAIVAEALLLGLFGLVRFPLALAAGALVTWLLAWRFVPAGDTAPVRQLASAWAGLSIRQRAGCGLVAGAALAWVAWPVRHPVVGYDGIQYHLPEIVGWVRSGHPGELIDVSYLFPASSYPVTNEVAMTWLTSLSGGFTFAAAWTPLLHVLLALAAWLGLRRLEVPRVAAGLAIAALCLMPLVAIQSNQPSTDLAGLTWAVVTAALAAAGTRNPRLLPVAVVAAGLAVGTKTSTVPLTAVALAAGLFSARAHLRSLGRPLALACLVATGVGLVWYLRNLALHGSPLYPFVQTPGGDPPAQLWKVIQPSLLDRPVDTLSGRMDDYIARLGGGVVLLVAAALMPVIVRTRAVALTSVAAIGAMLLWANAPSTGQPDAKLLEPNVLSTIRYALPALAVVTLVPAIAARAGRRAALLSALVLTVAVGWNLVKVADIGSPVVPSIWWIAAGAAFAAVAGAALRTLSPRRPVAITAVVLTSIAAGLVLGQQAGSYLQRLAPHTSLFPAASTIPWFNGLPGFHQDERPIAISGQMAGPLAGNELSHAVTLIPPAERCAAIRRRAARGWVIIASGGALEKLVRTPDVGCFDGVRPVFARGAVRVFGPSR